MTDPREQPLNDVARGIMVQANYDPHFSGIEDRLMMETKLFLARLDALMGYYRKDMPDRIQAFYEKAPALGGLEGAFRDNEKLPIETIAQSTAFKINNGSKDQTEEIVLAALRRLQIGLREKYDLEIAKLQGDIQFRSPIPMILFCPSCGVQHIDKAEPHKWACAFMESHGECNCGAWQNPPHRSHRCHYCDHIWRPADVATTGVKDINTQGSADSPNIVRRVIDRILRFRPRWRHKVRGGAYTEIARGELQMSNARQVQEGDRLVAYQGDDNKVWFRFEPEFDDGRFEALSSREEAYGRDDCMFGYCPAVGLCKKDDKCRHPKTEDDRFIGKHPALGAPYGDPKP